MNIYSSVYSGKNTKNVTEDRNCIQLNAMFLVNTEGSENSYYVREMAVLDDETVFVNCSQGQYSYDTAIYKISNGVQELYYTSNIKHYRMQVDFNGNLYFISEYVDTSPESLTHYCIVKLDANKVRTIIVDLPADVNIDEYIISSKANKIYVLFMHNLLKEYDLTTYALTKSVTITKPSTYGSNYYFDAMRLFLAYNGSVYIYGYKNTIE